MSRSSARRGSVEPIAAVAALFAVTAGLGLYAGVLDDARPTSDRDVATPTLDRVHERASDLTVVDPGAIDAARRAGPDGYRVNVTVRADGRRWAAGPAPPTRADHASRSVSVRLAPGRLRAGRLRVEVWT